MITLFENSKDCAGCTACVNKCPKKAITLIEDKEGFLYPKIDNDKCVECGICLKTCPIRNDNRDSITQTTYLSKNKNAEIRKNSSSGGTFYALAEFIIKEKGIVYGAILNEKMEVIHSKTNSIKELKKMMGSKYVQSNLGEIFKDIQNELINNKKILFVGTPCQVAGLKSFLGKKYDTLFLCDLVCHGVPSPKIWNEYVKLVEDKSNKKLKNYIFRSKINGWHSHTEIAEFLNGDTEKETSLINSNKELFYSSLVLRPSCYSCKFANTNRISDITIADAWGIEKVAKEFDDNLGTSLVIVNTKNGEKLFNNIADNLLIKQIKLNDCLQPQLKHPIKEPSNRDAFWNYYYKKGFESVLKKYTKYGFILKAKYYIRCKLSNIKQKLIILTKKTS